ncbi:NfeD family protein [Gilvimarinus sp. F26214L]|uniref:NfeD family protein n=1 Tax=Gilvimarinus sp. DZF01 TaxID=3461371 RepID=UPI0040455881
MAQSEPEAEQTGWLLLVQDVIGPASADYVRRGIERAEREGAGFVILQMDTPGGLDPSMRTIIQAILSSPIPIVTYVAPSGARAASAGTYILYASHVASMAPATNLGAATPVQIAAPGMPDSAPDDNGQEQTQPGSAMERKIVNDAMAYIESLAELRGRNSEWAKRAVREGVSLSAQQALGMDVIEIVAADMDDLLRQLDGRQVAMDGGALTLKTENASIVRAEPDWRSRFLAVITNPNVAYILMLVGIYGLIFEFSNPGIGGPGIIGAICLLLALYAFQVLPVSYVGLGLIVVGLGLMAAEAFVPSFGALGVGGAAAFVIGSIILMDTELPAYRIALPVILALALASVGMLVFVLGMLFKSRQHAVVSGAESLIGAVGTVEQVGARGPLVRVQGELWHVRSDLPLRPGDRVKVRALRDLVLTVDKLEE